MVQGFWKKGDIEVMCVLCRQTIYMHLFTTISTVNEGPYSKLVWSAEPDILVLNCTHAHPCYSNCAHVFKNCVMGITHLHEVLVG